MVGGAPDVLMGNTHFLGGVNVGSVILENTPASAASPVAVPVQLENGHLLELGHMAVLDVLTVKLANILMTAGTNACSVKQANSQPQQGLVPAHSVDVASSQQRDRLPAHCAQQEAGTGVALHAQHAVQGHTVNTTLMESNHVLPANMKHFH